MPATNELLQEGRYRINLQTPLDGKANVYEAYDTVRESNVVVKEISARSGAPVSASQAEALKADFDSKAKVLTAIEHDSLLQVHDYFSEIGRQYLVMEAVDGDDLAELLDRNKSAFAVSDVTEWADQILDALNYLHTFKPPIFHRNVRPENIKLSSAGKIKLLAMGTSDRDRLSTSLTDDASDSAINYSPLELIWDGLDAASQKIILGGYDDRSERLLKEPADARSDIYSLGATLYHLVTGRAPVDPLERSIEMLEGNADPLAAPHKVDSKIPVELSEVLMRALEIKRENRFDSAVIMRQVVRTAMVRAGERANDAERHEEARELAEAAEDIRRAEKSRGAAKPSVADKEQKLRQEALAKQLREAEAQKAAAEKLETEKAQKEKQAAEAAKRAEEERAKREAQERAQAEADAVLKELKQDLLEIDAEPVEEPKKKSKAAAAAAGDAASDVDASTQTAEQTDEIELGGMFAEKPAGKGGMGMAMIGGIAGVLLVIAVAGWLLLSSGGSTPEQRPTAAPPVVQIPPTEPQQSASTTAATAPETSAPAAQPSGEVQASQAALQNRPAAQPAAPKAKKDEKEAPKPADKKKSVTVDDLINDN